MDPIKKTFHTDDLESEITEEMLMRITPSVSTVLSEKTDPHFGETPEEKDLFGAWTFFTKNLNAAQHEASFSPLNAQEIIDRAEIEIRSDAKKTFLEPLPAKKMSAWKFSQNAKTFTKWLVGLSVSCVLAFIILPVFFVSQKTSAPPEDISWEILETEELSNFVDILDVIQDDSLPSSFDTEIVLLDTRLSLMNDILLDEAKDWGNDFF
ncbi:MAG: hypothetical protein Q4C96_08115 [Planctomycetia bacterium]|nr:hypothetical protein [Planctomycetia bacterium]